MPSGCHGFAKLVLLAGIQNF
uniref:Uncharacterized protein n=1 Tax=Arundo donax TaxID=35708 RepID=A0A0A9FNY7_ARUDO